MLDASDTNTPCYAPKIYGARGIVKENIFAENERVLHLGSGSKRLPGATTVDVLSLPGVDIVHDLDVTPWPFADNEFSVVYAHNVLEHLNNQIAVMEEIHRVLKPGGHAVIAVPHFRCVDAWSDPTHRHFYTAASMDSFLDTETSAGGYGYTTKRFTRRGFWFGWPQPSRNPLVRLFKRFIRKHPYFYDQYLSFVFPVDILVWELEAKK
jgi:SAM-dependent methyltransferase